MQGTESKARRPTRILLRVRETIKHSYHPYQTRHAREIVSSWSLKVIQGLINHKVVTLKPEKQTEIRAWTQPAALFTHVLRAQRTKHRRGDQPVLLLGEDRDPRGLEDSDLHQGAVGLHRFTVVKGDDKQLRHRRGEADEANEAETNVQH